MKWNRLSMVALGVGFALLPGCRRAPVQPRTAGGGELLLLAIPSAVAVVSGRVEESRRIDDNLYAAWLQVDRVLAGTIAPAARVRIAWDEPVPNRAPRLADGDHIVVAIDQLPAGSPWLARLSAAGKGEPVFAIGAKGDAFLREPDTNSMSVLSRYLSLPPAARTAADGVNVLTEFVAQGAPGLSAAAIMRLDALPDLDKNLDAEAMGHLQQALSNPARPLDLRRAIIALAARRRLAGFHDWLVALGQPGSPLEADAVAALGSLDGRLSAQQVEALLNRREPNMRALGVRFARDPALQPQLAALVRSDEAPLVRATAARTLVEVRGIDALPQVAPALADADAGVRTEAARTLGGLGDAAVPPLVALVRSGNPDQAKGAIMALGLAGPGGAKALAEVAASHPNEQVRNLAQLALAKTPKRN